MALTPQLTQKTLVLAKIESVYNTDAVPTPAANALLVSACDVKPALTPLNRTLLKSSLTPEPFAAGRKLVTVTMTHELKGSGAAATAPKVGTLLRGCGMGQTSVTAGATNQVSPVSAPISANYTGPTISFAKTAAPTSRYDYYDLVVSTGGASATAKFQVIGAPNYEGDTTVINSQVYGDPLHTSETVAGTVTAGGTIAAPTVTIGGTWLEGERASIYVGGVRFQYIVANSDTNDLIAAALAALVAADGRFTSTSATTNVISVLFAGSAAQTAAVTSGTTAVTLGASGAQVTPTWSGSLILGEVYRVYLLRVGFHYKPVSSSFESLTIYVYYDGTLHRITGCRGTWTLQGAAGALATIQFTFTGQYLDPLTAALPTGARIEESKPQQVANAQLTVDSLRQLCAQNFSMDIANTVSVHECMSGPDGYDGVLITARAPTGGVDPDSMTEATFPWWRKLSNAEQMKFHVQVGSALYNTVHVQAGGAQISSMAYKDRNGVHVYDVSMGFNRPQGSTGDDEIELVFEA